MKLVKLECPNCNAKLEGSSELKKFTCNYCGTTMVLDDENVTVNSVSSKLKNSIEDLKDYYENGNYDAAIELATELMEEYPANEEIEDYYIKSSLMNIDNTYDVMQSFVSSQSLFYEYPENKKIQNVYKEKAINLYKEFINSTDINLKLFYFEKILSISELLKIFTNDDKLKQLHLELKNNIIDFFNANMENNQFRNDVNCPNPDEFQELIDQVYPDDEKMKEIFNKYAETYKEPDRVVNTSNIENNSLDKENMKENFILTLIFVDIPIILLLPFIMLTVHYEYETPYLVFSIVTVIFLIIGIVCKCNSCKVCGKFNGYQAVGEQVLDSWVTTEEKNEYDNRTNSSRKVYVTVTKESVRITDECMSCGDTRYRIITRTKY